MDKLPKVKVRKGVAARPSMPHKNKKAYTRKGKKNIRVDYEVAFYGNA